MKQLLARTMQLHSKLTSRPIPWRRVILRGSLYMTIGLFVLSIPSLLHAQGASLGGGVISAIADGAVANNVASFFARITLLIVQGVIALTFFALKFFITLAGYSGFSNAPIVNIGWTLVRDVANMFFIVALLVIAFATILGREDYALKKTLGKLILMAILVNFSKLIAQIIIDVAHVVTMTFLNAVSAIAGGNLIQLFKFDNMRNIIAENASNANSNRTSDIGLELLLAAGISLMLATVAFTTILVYMIIMVWRVVTLWTLIVISPLTFALSALPGTANIGRDWWSRFTKNVVSAPIMVFFLWLAFATLGNGAVLSQITDQNANSLPASETGDFTDSENFASISEATTWENMAAFVVAVAFLFAGIEEVQKLGVKGGDQLSKVEKWGTRAAMLGGGMLLGGLAYKGTKKLVGATIGDKAKDYVLANKSAAKAQLMSLGRRDEDQIQGSVQKFLARKVRKHVKRKKWVKKMEGAAEDEEKMVYTRNEAKSGGHFGIYQFDELDADGNAITDHKGNPIPRDRYLEGVMKGEQERKAAKDAEIQGLGRQQVLESGRLKDGKRSDRGTMQDEIVQRNIRAEEHNAAAESNKAEATKEYINSKKGQAVLKATAAAKGTSEITQDLTEKEQDRINAEEKRDLYIDNNQDTRATAVMRAFEDKWFKKMQEMFEGVSYTDHMLATKQMSKELAEFAKREDNGETLSGKDVDRRRELMKQKVAQESLMNAKGYEYAMDSHGHDMAAIGWTEEINDENRVRAALSRRVGYVVGDSDEEMNKAAELFHGAYDTEEGAQAALRSLLASQKDVAGKGVFTEIGTLNEMLDQEGNLQLRLGGGLGKPMGSFASKNGVDIDKDGYMGEKKDDGSFVRDKDDDGNDVKYTEYEIGGNQKYFQTRQNTRSLEGIKAMVGARIIGGSKKISSVGDSARKNVIEAFSGKNQHTIEAMPSTMWDEWNEMAKTIAHLRSDPANTENVAMGEQLLEDAQKLTTETINSLSDDKARVSFVNNADKLMKLLLTEDATLKAENFSSDKKGSVDLEAVLEELRK